MISLPTLQSERLSVCHSCPHYKEPNTCYYIVMKTGKRGRLDHPNGIGNPKARCPHPDRHWQFIISYHPWQIQSQYIELTYDEQFMFTWFGIQWLKPIGVTTLIHSRMTTPPLRSLLLQDLGKLMQEPNSYQHITDALIVNYISGELTRPAHPNQ